jgi:hypothetical protein
MRNVTPLLSVKSAYHETNLKILQAVRELSDSQIRWQPHVACHSIAFILWHVARWSDHLQATIPGMTKELSRQLQAGEQIWDNENLALHWGLNPDKTGESETGTHFDIEASGEPVWPEKSILLDYAERVFAAADYAISVIDEEQFQEIEQPQHDTDYLKEALAKTATVGNALMNHLIHNAQHLGEIDYLTGLLDQIEHHALLASLPNKKLPKSD